MRTHLLPAVFLAWTATACAPAVTAQPMPPNPPSSTPAGTPSARATPSQASTSAPASAVVPEAVQGFLPALLADAAQRSGAASQALQVRRAQAVTWSDGSLGCPQPGRMYTQALMPGWLIEVATPSGTVLRYHASARGGWLHCPADRAKTPYPDEEDRSK